MQFFVQVILLRPTLDCKTSLKYRNFIKNGINKTRNMEN